MGTTLDITINFCKSAQDCSLESSDWIAIFSVLINSGLAYWIVKTIQNRLTNKRTLKDHLISEVIELRSNYRDFFNNLYTNKTYPKTVTPYLKLMNIKIVDLMDIIKKEYKIKNDLLIPYQVELGELITNNHDFISQFNENRTPMKFSANSLNEIIKFQQDNNKLFNDLIIQINKA